MIDNNKKTLSEYEVEEVKKAFIQKYVDTYEDIFDLVEINESFHRMDDKITNTELIECLYGELYKVLLDRRPTFFYFFDYSLLINYGFVDLGYKYYNLFKGLVEDEDEVAYMSLVEGDLLILENKLEEATISIIEAVSVDPTFREKAVEQLSIIEKRDDSIESLSRDKRIKVLEQTFETIEKIIKFDKRNIVERPYFVLHRAYMDLNEKAKSKKNKLVLRSAVIKFLSFTEEELTELIDTLI